MGFLEDRLCRLMEEEIQLVVQELKPVLGKLKPDLTLTTGTWANGRGITTAYLSCFPHGDPAEQTVDAVMSIAIADHRAGFSSDICWSDGSLMAEGFDSDLGLDNTEHFWLKAPRVCLQAREAFVRQLPTLLVEAESRPK